MQSTSQTSKTSLANYETLRFDTEKTNNRDQDRNRKNLCKISNIDIPKTINFCALQM